MKKLVLITFLIAFCLPFNLLAKPVSRANLTIRTIHPMAVDRTHCPRCSGLTRIYVDKGAWGDTNCRPDAGDLFKEDSHILSVLLTAWTTGKKITIEVNDQNKPLDEVCKITAVFVN